MKLYFLRHGVADWPDWNGPDNERPLTKGGQKEVRRVAEALAEHGVQTDVILSSPLPRAQQTAEIAGAALGSAVSVEAALAPGFNVEALRTLLRAHDGRNVMFVGHEPDFSRMVEALTGGSVVMAKAAVARVDLANAAEERGVLRWLVTPKILL
jgi:phosphohistidine phosphatase